MIAALLSACAAPGPYGAAPGPLELAVPEILSFRVDCEVDAGTWIVEVETSSWTGGGTTWWTTDALYVEKHPITTLSYEPDGSGETLLQEIAIVDDWRLAGPKDTSFTCADEPNVVFHLSDVEGNAADCRAYGPAPAIFTAVEGVVPCTKVWHPE